MRLEQTLPTLNTPALYGMAKSLAQRLAHADLTHEEFVGFLVQDEQPDHDNQRLQRLLKFAKLRQSAALEDIDFKHPRGLAEQVFQELAHPAWITRDHNVFFTGPTGIGMPRLACALVLPCHDTIRGADYDSSEAPQ